MSFLICEQFSFIGGLGGGEQIEKSIAKRKGTNNKGRGGGVGFKP
jgi:hypothetical protein